MVQDYRDSHHSLRISFGEVVFGAAMRAVTKSLSTGMIADSPVVDTKTSISECWHEAQVPMVNSAPDVLPMSAMAGSTLRIKVGWLQQDSVIRGLLYESADCFAVDDFLNVSVSE